jgi:hypothetical protein
VLAHACKMKLSFGSDDSKPIQEVVESDDGNSPGNESMADDWSKHWVRCIDKACECYALLFVNGQDEQACGALIETGAALEASRTVFVASPVAGTFSHDPICRNFSTLADAIAAIMAMQAGEAARGYWVGISGTNSR